MEKKKALLVVAGGRQTPDVIALYCVQPHLTVIVTSEQGWKNESVFVEIAESLPNNECIDFIRGVNAYNLDVAIRACKDAIAKVSKDHPENELDWTFSISSGPKIIGIAAYELAREHSIPCLYVDTREKKVVSLIKDIGVTSDDIFHMDVSHYMRIQQRTLAEYSPEKKAYRDTVGKWGQLARTLALSKDTSDFIKEIRDKPKGVFVLLPQYLTNSSLVQDLEKINAIEVQHNNDGTISCAFTSKNFAKFIGTGDWLEVYIWDEVNKLNIADDCQWGYEIKSSASNELDVVLTYQAQLIFVECKTEGEPFKEKIKHLDTISAKAEMLGKTYVTKIFITSESKEHKGYENFVNQAHLRQIVVATYENLPSIGQLLKKQAEDPTFSRI